MRNLKKVLALVLALAMALSVMASAFTAPEYTEEAQAEYDAMTAAQQNAFYVVSALGIVEGFSDGSFRPEENLTRAQFAAMVYRAKTGDVAKENTLFSSASVAMFSDAIDTWAVPYVAYAYSAGIVAGYPDGTFKATKAVTGLEAAKMLLTALGYDAEIEGLVGPTFYANTIKLGTAVGLFNGVKGDIYAPATRADAFVMFANALKANTVSYVGGVATPKTETLNSEDIITLGEEGFDLLDVEAILVATEDVALGAYWRNILGNSGIVYRDYDVAPAGYARFVYRDYVASNAANYGANYYDRVITVALGDQAAKFSELGEKYRLLVTDLSPVYNENEFRVLYGAPVACENDGYYAVKTGEVNGLKKYDGKVIIDTMLARAKAVDASVTDETVDGTIFVNGSAVSFKAAKAYEEKASTAPYKLVDNDNDGVVDALFIYDYAIATVKAIDDENVTFIGAGLGKVAKSKFAALPELAVGDYVAVWNDTDYKYAKKLDVKEANVTGYNADGYTIDGAKYVAGAYINAGAESLLGDGSAAITETVYKFVFDGSYIVNVELTENTRFAKYALVWETAFAENYLGYPLVKLYTEDNEVINAYVKTVNGVQVYAYGNNFFLDIQANDLVSYTLDGEYVYLDVIGQGRQGTGVAIEEAIGQYADTFDGNYVTDDYDFAYNRATDTWTGRTVNSDIAMKDTHGVVFVSYMGGAAKTFRAYYNGEFQPSYYNDFEAKMGDGNNDLVVYATQNGVNYIKAAVITFNDTELYGYALPGLPTTRDGDNIVIIKNVSVEKTAEGYVYTYTTYAPWNTTETYTSVPFAYQQAQPKNETVWNLKTNADGKVTSLVAVDILAGGLLEDTANVIGSNGFEMRAYNVTAFNMDVYGNIVMTLSDVSSVNGGFTAAADTYTINLTADTDVWFFEAKADGTGLSAKDWFSYVGYDYNNAPSDKKFAAYVDLNPTTQTATRVILVSGAYADEIATVEVDVKARVLYDLDTLEFGFALLDAPVMYADIFNALVGEFNADEHFELTPANLPGSQEVEFTFENIDGVWAITAVKYQGDRGVIYDGVGERNFKITEDYLRWEKADFVIDDFTLIDTADIDLVYRVDTNTDGSIKDLDIIFNADAINDHYDGEWDKFYDADKLAAVEKYLVIEAADGESYALVLINAEKQFINEGDDGDITLDDPQDNGDIVIL